MVAISLAVPARSEERQLLDVRRAEVALREAESNVQQARTLFEQGLISRAELNRVEGQRERAAIDREQATLALSSELPSFQVLSAIKQPDVRGGNLVTIRLRPLAAATLTGAPRQYVVSLTDASAIVAEPYQRVLIVGIASQMIQELSFRLLRDLDEVRIVIMSGSRREEVPLLLQRSSRGPLLRMTCATPSQEGTIGRKVEYALQVERFDSGPRIVQFVLDGLPGDFRWSLLDAESKATVTGLSFAEGENQRKLIVQVFVPERVAADILRRPLPFQFRLLDGDRSVAGEYPLQLNVVGAPRLVVHADRLLISAFNDEPSVIAIRIENVGSQEAPEVRVDVVLPIGFSADMKPLAIRAIPAGESATVQVRITPTDEAVPGDYSLRVTAFTVLRQLRFESEEQVFRVAYTRRRSFPLAVVLGITLMVAVVLLVHFLRRSRRALS